MTTAKTGTDIDAYCTRCQLELAHVVVAMVQGRVARVQCKTCGTVHAYRRSEGPSPRRTDAGPGGARRASAARSAYDELMQGKDISRAQRYKPTLRFAPGDVLHHPTFALGLVAKLLSDDKIEVVFADATRVLVHGRA